MDLLVIGGGITGAGIARDAAMRGMRVGLVERGDFASGTSSRSSKLIHGGLRYLEQGEVGLVFEAATERRTLCRIAPHLAVAARMIVPVFGRTGAGLVKLRAGIWTFEKMARVGDIDRHEIWRRDETVHRVRGIATDRLQGAAVYTEYITDDARLTLETIKSAKRYGALIVSYAPAMALEEASAVVTSSGNGKSVAPRLRVRLRDELSGAEHSVEAAVVVNAAGPWIDRVRAMAGGSEPRMQLTKGIHVVVPRERLAIEGIVVMRTLDRRMVFAVPHNDVVWIGTTDTFYPEPVERPTITREDVSYLLEATNRTWPAAAIGEGDVQGAWAGVRPLLRQDGKTPSEISRRDEIFIEPNGLLSIGGGKLTTYRQMAERVVDEAARRLAPGARPCRTAEVPLVENGAPIAMARTDLEQSDIAYSIEEECALTVSDVLERRARANLFSPQNGVGDAPRVAAALAQRLGWSNERQAREIDAYRRRIAEDVAWREGGEPVAMKAPG